MPRRMKRFGARPSHTTRRSRITKKHKARWEVSIRGKSTHHVDERERSFDAARAKEGEAVSMASLLSKQRDRRVWEGTRFQRFLRDSHTILAKTSGGEHSQILMERNTRVIDIRIAFSLLSWGGGVLPIRVCRYSCPHVTSCFRKSLAVSLPTHYYAMHPLPSPPTPHLLLFRPSSASCPTNSAPVTSSVAPYTTERLPVFVRLIVLSLDASLARESTSWYSP